MDDRRLNDLGDCRHGFLTNETPLLIDGNCIGPDIDSARRHVLVHPEDSVPSVPSVPSVHYIHIPSISNNTIDVQLMAVQSHGQGFHGLFSHYLHLYLFLSVDLKRHIEPHCHELVFCDARQ